MPAGFFHKVKGSMLFVVSALLLWTADRLTKLAVIENIPWEAGSPTYHFGSGKEPIPVLDGYVYLVHITNEGAAWGLFSGRTYFLSSVAILALAAMWFFRKELELDNPAGKLCAGLFAGGVLGNLADRILYGHVIDFIDVHIPILGYRWPAFNVADCGICVGVCVYIAFALACDWRRKKKAQQQR